MNTLFFFDTETTGLPQFRECPEAPGQPHIVQIAGLLMTEDRRKVAELACIIRPDGYEIPPESTEIHGITTQRALDEGVDIRLAMNVFYNLSWEADLRVAHSVNFDELMVEIEACRLRPKIDPLWKPEQPDFCTMKTARSFCKIPHANGRGNKWPKLEEAYQLLCGKELPDAHEALADVRACAEIYFELQRRIDREAS